MSAPYSPALDKNAVANKVQYYQFVAEYIAQSPPLIWIRAYLKLCNCMDNMQNYDSMHNFYRTRKSSVLVESYDKSLKTVKVFTALILDQTPRKVLRH